MGNRPWSRKSINKQPEGQMTRSALITGITGQDGSYLAELLLEKGYRVHGLVRRSSSFSTGRIDHLYRDIHEQPQLLLHYGDLTDGQALTNLVQEIEPDEIYNLGAQSHVRVSFDQPVYTLMSDGVGALNVLEAARLLKKRKDVRACTKHPVPKCTAWCWKRLKPKRHPSTHNRRTHARRFMRFSKPSIIAAATTCSPAMGSFLIMNPHAEARPS